MSTLPTPDELFLFSDGSENNNCEDIEKGDFLNFEAYAEQLQRAIRISTGPLTIGILGEWGTGKTSLMHRIRCKLTKRETDDADADKVIIPIWFNIWQYHQVENPLVPLLNTIWEQVRAENKSINAEVTSQELMKRLLKAIKKTIGMVKVKMPLGGSGGPEIELSASNIFLTEDNSSEIGDEHDRSGSIESYQALWKHFTDDVKLVIFVDDMDRCLPEVALKLLEYIKLIFSLHNLIFVLGISRSTLDSYLTARYRDTLGISNFNARDYLDKLLHVSFYIPRHTSRVGQFVENQLKQIKNDRKRNEFRDIANILRIAAAYNLRAANRLMNILSIDYEIINGIPARGGTRQHIPLGFFAIYRSLQRWPEMFELLMRPGSHELCFRISTWNLENIEEQGFLLQEDQDECRAYDLLTEDMELRQLLSTRQGKAWLRDEVRRTSASEYYQDFSNDGGLLLPDNDIYSDRSPTNVHTYPTNDGLPVGSKPFNAQLFKDLDQWIAPFILGSDRDSTDTAQNVMCVVYANSGMGKSALTAHWFATKLVAEQKIRWDFYLNNSFDSFVITALQSLRGSKDKGYPSLEQVLSWRNREQLLIDTLCEQKCFVLLDGLEAILDASKEKKDLAYPKGKNDRERLQKFLSSILTRVREDKQFSSRILMTSFEEYSKQLVGNLVLLEGQVVYVKLGSPPPEALEQMWQKLGFQAKNSDDQQILNLASQVFETNPLLIRTIGGLINYVVPNDDNRVAALRRWIEENREHLEASQSTEEKLSCIIGQLTPNLDEVTKSLLRIVSLFHEPIERTLILDLMWATHEHKNEKKENIEESLLRLRNRFILTRHEIADRTGQSTNDLWDVHPRLRDALWHRLSSFSDAQEVFNQLIDLGRQRDDKDYRYYGFAYDVFLAHLNYHSLSIEYSKVRRDLLIRFFERTHHFPRLNKPHKRAIVLAGLATAYVRLGYPEKATSLIRNQIQIRKRENHNAYVARSLRYLAYVLRLQGRLREAEVKARYAQHLSELLEDQFEAAMCARELGMILSIMAPTLDPAKASIDDWGAKSMLMQAYSQLQNLDALDINGQQNSGYLNAAGTTLAYIAQRYLWCDDAKTALVFAERALECAERGRSIFKENYWGDLVQSLRLRGSACIPDRLEDGRVYLSQSMEELKKTADTHKVDYLEELIPTSIAFAKLENTAGNVLAASRYLENIMALIEQGPYPLFKTDFLNTMAEIQLNMKDPEGALMSARAALAAAHCGDKSPYIYHYGLKEAKRILSKLGTPHTETQ